MEIENYLSCIPDHRRGQGKLYDLGSLLLFSIMAVLSDVVNLFETIQLSYFFHFNQLFFKIIRTAIVQV